MRCGRCGAENPDGFRFCGACGARLVAAPAARQERKVITVLFADLVGFTSRAEQLDPEDVHGMLSPYHARLRDELERFEGTVEKFIGDAVVALFGAPVAHEDDAERAVRAAIAVRNAVGQMNESEPGLDLHIRIGVNTGEALVALGALPGQGEGMASGDVINTASRLQTAAPIDGILVGEQTYRATEGVIEYREVAPIEVKGKAAPVPVWEALEARARLGIDLVTSRRSALVGRDRELELVEGALARARQERSSQLVTLIGEPGIGKSRLVAELFQKADRDPEFIVWRQGRCLPYGDAVSYWAFGEMIKGQAGILETDGDEATAQKLSRCVSALIAEPEDAAWVERHLRPLVGLASEPLTGDRRPEAFAAWHRFIEGLADETPTVLVFEDLHWADDGLLDFLDHLVERTTDVPLLVLCTARPELLARRRDWGGGKPNAATVSLSPLSAQETEELLGNLLDGEAISADVRTSVLTRAGGNPLYAEEFARMVTDRPPDDASLPVPESVQGVIAARLDALDPDEKVLLQDAAVIGKVFWLGAVSAVGGADPLAAEEALHQLGRRQFVRRERRSSLAGETEYAFLHVMVRDVAYGQIPRSERAEKHRAAAEWMTALTEERLEDRAEMIAQHYLAALQLTRAAGLDDPTLTQPARRALIAAGDRAAALNAFGGALRYYREAVALWAPGEPGWAETLFRYGRMRWRYEEQGAAELTEARGALLADGNHELAAEAEIMLGDLKWNAGDRDAAFGNFDHARELVEERPTSSAKAWVLAHISRFLMLAGRDQETLEVGRTVLSMAEELNLPDLRAHTLNNIGVSRTILGDVGGLDDIRASIALSQQTNSPWDEARGYLNLASVVGNLGDLRETAELHRKGEEITRRFGLASGSRFLLAERILDLYEAGEWGESAPLADDFIAEIDRGSPHYMEPVVRYTRGEMRLARGDLAGSIDDATRALAAARRAKDPQILQPAIGSYAASMLGAGKEREALAAADELIALASTDATSGHWPLWLVPMAWVLVSTGRGDDLLPLLERSRPRTPWAEAAQAIVEGDPVTAADLLYRIGSLPLEARIRAFAGRSLIGDGRVAEGEEQLQRALRFYRRVGATAYARSCEELLATRP